MIPEATLKKLLLQHCQCAYKHSQTFYDPMNLQKQLLHIVQHSQDICFITDQEKSNKNYYSHTEANGTLSDFSVQAIKFNCSLITWVKFITWHGREVVGIKLQRLNTSSKLCNEVLFLDQLMISTLKKQKNS